MGTPYFTNKREYLDKPMDYTAISRKTGGNFGLAGIDALALGYECTRHVPTANATHVVLTKHR